MEYRGRIEHHHLKGFFQFPIVKQAVGERIQKIAVSIEQSKGGAEDKAGVLTHPSQQHWQKRRHHAEEERSRQLYQVANGYAEDALARTEEAVQAALDEVKQSRVRFRAASNAKMQEQRQKLEQKNYEDNG